MLWQLVFVPRASPVKLIETIEIILVSMPCGRGSAQGEPLAVRPGLDKQYKKVIYEFQFHLKDCKSNGDNL
jgi:hypothetical protein